jgi:hypothetical protein
VSGYSGCRAAVGVYHICPMCGNVMYCMLLVNVALGALGQVIFLLRVCAAILSTYQTNACFIEQLTPLLKASADTYTQEQPTLNC